MAVARGLQSDLNQDSFCEGGKEGKRLARRKLRMVDMFSSRVVRSSELGGEGN